MQTGRISASFFIQARTTPILNAPPLPGGFQTDRLYQRLMDCKGSMSNRADFVLAYKDINQYKTRIVMGKEIIDPDKWKDRYLNDDPTDALYALRTAISVIHYMNRPASPPVQPRLAHVVNLIFDEWQRAENQWNAQNPNDRVRVAAAWAEWARAQMQFNVDHTTQWVRRGITDMRRMWAVRTGEQARATLETMERLENELPALTISIAGFPG
jgi:chitinase